MSIRLDEQSPPWQTKAACRDVSKEVFFPDWNESLSPAYSICERCEVIDDCLAYAMSDLSLIGVWGGTSHRGRLRMAAGKAPRRFRMRPCACGCGAEFRPLNGRQICATSECRKIVAGRR